MRIEEDAFLHFQGKSDQIKKSKARGDQHLLKLVTGVEISTRPVRKLAREGKLKKSTRRVAVADTKAAAVSRLKSKDIGAPSACF